MTAALIILALMSVPLTAIISRTVLKSKELGSRLAQAELRALTAQNADLMQRVEVLETIATQDGHYLPEDPGRLQLPSAHFSP